METLYSYRLEDGGMREVQLVMKMFRCGFRAIGGIEVGSVIDRDRPGSIEYRLAGGSSVTVSASGSEPEIEVRISIIDDGSGSVSGIEKRVREDIENIVYINQRAGYCCE